MNLTPADAAVVLKRDSHRCVVCGFSARAALAVHHVVPRSLGGLGSRSNLSTLCANCHRTVHWLSVGRRIEGKAADDLVAVFGPKPLAQLRRLAGTIRWKRRRRMYQWKAQAGVSRARYTLAEVVDGIALRNGFDPREKALLGRTIRRVIKRIPPDVRRQCSFRLLRDGRYFGINAGNHLLFRTPAYSDGGERQDADVFLIWLRRSPISVLSKREMQQAIAFPFAAIPCVNLALNFEDVFALHAEDWRVFAEGCRAAMQVKTRSWVSNVTVV